MPEPHSLAREFLQERRIRGRGKRNQLAVSGARHSSSNPTITSGTTVTCSASTVQSRRRAANDANDSRSVASAGTA